MRNRSGFGWMELVVGILMIALGILSLACPDRAVAGFVILYGIMAVITGICDIVFYVRTERFTGFGPVTALIMGVLSVMAGVMLLMYPAAGAWAMALLFPIWFIAHSISGLTHLGIIRISCGGFCYGLSLAADILGIALGFIMLFQPVLTVFTFGFIVGAYLVLLGVSSVVLAFSELGSGD